MNTGGEPMKPFKIIVEKHPDGYVGYHVGMKGVAVGEGKEISRFTFSWDGGLQLSGRISTV